MPDIGPFWSHDVQRLRLGDIEIDLRYRSVHRGGQAYELNPRCFDLLLVFLREPGVLQTREAIFRKVWSGAVVEDASLTNCIWLMRRAFGGGAKQWIRTVPKQGYVFDPPAGVHLEPCSVDDAPVVPAAIVATPSVPLPQTPQRSAPPTRAAARGRPFVAAAAIVFALMLGGAALLRADNAAHAPKRIALIAVTDAAAPDDARWPVGLLHGWLDWQLRSFPDLAITTTSDACRDCGELAVVLGVELSPRDEGQWQVAARFRGPSPPADIVRASSAEKLVATLDDVGRDVLRALEPALDRSTYPPLSLDAATAAALASGLDAERRHRWSDAVRAYTTVVEKAPAFGFARVRLGQGLVTLGQQGAAQAELKSAAAWIEALPTPLRSPMQAQQALILNDYDQAAAAFASLQREGGDVIAWRLAEAESLRRLGRTREAAGRLAGEPPQQPASALSWHLQRAETEIANRDLPRAIRSARTAMDIAGRLGWEHERARATLLVAQAQAENGEAVDVAPLGRAVQAFDAAGDKLGALRARVASELFAPQATTLPHLDELLAEARLAGNVGVEIDALRRAALFHDGLGDIARARERFAQAAAVAESSGSSYERRLIDLNLLQEDTLRLDFAAVDRRLALLRAEPLQGRFAYSVGLNTARLAYLRGQFDDALTTLKNTEDTLRAGEDLPQIAFANGCLRAAIHMVQGRTSASRNDIRECRAAGLPALNHFADIASAELAIHAGDLVEARRLLAPMRGMLDALDNQQDRWNLAIEVAPLLARVGELDAAQHLVDGVLPAITRSQYHLMAANAHVTRAEIALAFGRADDAERDVAVSEALVPPDDWYERRRIRTVRALIAQARGETAQAARELESLHADALGHGDVLAELLVHSVMDPGTLAGDCSDRRHARLLAESGMRGASDIWMNPAAHEAGAALANAHDGE